MHICLGFLLANRVFIFISFQFNSALIEEDHFSRYTICRAYLCFVFERFKLHCAFVYVLLDAHVYYLQRLGNPPSCSVAVIMILVSVLKSTPLQNAASVVTMIR